MGALSVILLITFVVACLLIIFLVLLQNEEGDSIGGLFAGGSNSAFGSRSGNVLTKSTYVLVTVFFVSSFVLAVLNKTSSAPTEGIIKEGQEIQKEIQKENEKPWYEEEKKDDEKNVEIVEEKIDSEHSDASSPAQVEGEGESSDVTSEDVGVNDALPPEMPSAETEDSAVNARE